jgi:hypothetical protein
VRSGANHDGQLCVNSTYSMHVAQFRALGWPSENVAVMSGKLAFTVPETFVNSSKLHPPNYGSHKWLESVPQAMPLSMCRRISSRTSYGTGMVASAAHVLKGPEVVV